MIPEVTFAGRQSRGRRQNQEDCYGFCLLGVVPNAALLLALADGMGGHERGEIASAIAVENFLQRLDLRAGDIRQAMIDSLRASNGAIAAENGRHGGSPGVMGTTFVGTFLWRDQLQWVSVGDSPLYLYRAGEVHRLNEEHVADTRPSEKEPAGSAMLISALTGGVINRMDVPEKPVRLLKGDILVCATDGLNSIPKARIAGKLEVHGDLPAGELAEALVEAVEAERKASQDNVTVAIMKYQHVADELRLQTSS